MSKSRDQDVTKIHGEINQAVNHRFLLTTAGITAFALFSRNMIPSDNMSVESALKIAPHYFAYVSVLYLLYRQSYYLRRMIRAYTTYLIAKGWSTWEEDWMCARYNDKRILKKMARHDVRAHGFVFFGLAFFAFGIGVYCFITLHGPLQVSIGWFYNISRDILFGWSLEDSQSLRGLLLFIGILINIWLLIIILCHRFSLLASVQKEQKSIDAWRKCAEIETYDKKN